jgi:hypothetical protein
MVGYHLFTRQPKQKDDPEKPLATPHEQPTPPNPGDGPPADPKPKPADPASTAADSEPDPQSTPVEPPKPHPTPEPGAPKYLSPEDYPPFTGLMPPLRKHSPTDWLRNAYDNANDSQKIRLQIKLKDGRSKDVYVMILRGNNLMADSGNISDPHKNWDIITEAANEHLATGGNTAGITYDHYGKNGWNETPTFQKLRAYQRGRLEYFQDHAEYFTKESIPIPTHFQSMQIACGEIFTNEGADYGKPNGFQALTHILGPACDIDMHKLRTGYESLAREMVRLDAHSIHITGVSEALYARDPVVCAGMAVNGFLDSLMTTLQNADPATVDDEPIYVVFGRYNSGQGYTVSDNPASWTGGDAAYRDNLKTWRDAHSGLCH